MFKKAQAAMEFLMTYGWAILVVLVVIGALAYFGVLSPATLLPEKCTLPIQLNCNNHQVSGTPSATAPADAAALNTLDGKFTFVLQNGAGRSMLIRKIEVTSDALYTVTVDTITPILCSNDDWDYDTGADLDGDTDPTIDALTLRNGGTVTFTLDSDNDGSEGIGKVDCALRTTGRDKNRYNFEITYSWLDSSGIDHTLTGELLARTEDP